MMKENYLDQILEYNRLAEGMEEEINLRSGLILARVERHPTTELCSSPPPRFFRVMLEIYISGLTYTRTFGLSALVWENDTTKPIYIGHILRTFVGGFGGVYPDNQAAERLTS